MAKRMTDKQIINALQNSGGMIAHAAKALACNRVSLSRRIQNSESLKQALEDARETTLDDVQSVLIRNAKAGDNTACIFLLKCLGKSRGFVEKQSMDIAVSKDGEDKNNRILEALGLGGTDATDTTQTPN